MPPAMVFAVSSNERPQKICFRFQRQALRVSQGEQDFQLLMYQLTADICNPECHPGCNPQRSPNNRRNDL